MTTIDLTVGTSQPSSLQHPSSIVHSYCMWGWPSSGVIAIYVGGPPVNRDHVTGAKGPTFKGPGTGPLGGRNGKFPWACLKVVTMPPS